MPTGYSVLNKILVHESYVSNEKLCATKVVYPNGISHSVMKNDVGGADAILL